MKQPDGKLPMTTLSEEPAFPVNGATSWYPGMSLLDWFAGMAMQGLLSKDYYSFMSDLDDAVIQAYKVGHAMMEARKS